MEGYVSILVVWSTCIISLSLSLCLQTSSSSSDTPAEETFKKALRLVNLVHRISLLCLPWLCVMLGIALCLSLVYECVRRMRARQKVRQEGEMFVTPKTSMPLSFLTRETTWKTHWYLSRKSLHALLVTRIRHATLALARSIVQVEISLVEFKESTHVYNRLLRKHLLRERLKPTRNSQETMW